MSFGTLAYFAGIARAERFTTENALFARFAVAALVLLLVAARAPGEWPRGRRLAALLLLGGVGYVGEAWCYFKALEHAPAGLVALLLYLYPGIVTLLARVVDHEPITRPRALALAVATLGTALTIGPAGGAGWQGICFGLGAALLYSIYIVAGVRLTRGVHPLRSAALVSAGAAASYGAIAWIRGAGFPASPLGWGAVLILALVSTVVAFLTFFAALARIGPIATSTLSTLEALTTVGIGALLMGERLLPLQFLGGALILAGAVITARAEAPPLAGPRER